MRYEFFELRNLGSLVTNNEYPLEMTQRDAWLSEVQILKSVLVPYRDSGHIYFEYSIPRLGRRIDVVVIVQSVIFVLEFKVNESEFTSSAADQVCDYALDLKNFHETSHDLPIAPILIATEAESSALPIEVITHRDRMLVPINTNSAGLSKVFERVAVHDFQSILACSRRLIILSRYDDRGDSTVRTMRRAGATAGTSLRPRRAIGGGTRGRQEKLHELFKATLQRYRQTEKQAKGRQETKTRRAARPSASRAAALSR